MNPKQRFKQSSGASSVGQRGCRNAFFMCEPTSFGLRNGIIDALRRKDEWPMIVKNGRSLIESTFNWDSASKSLLAECSRLLLKAK